MHHIAGSELGLILAVFLASAVESVEAVTIILAAGISRHMRSSLQGALAAMVVLITAVAIFGPTINSLPKNALRLTIGGVLLLLGGQWLRKAVLRYSGVLALHDEAKIYQEEISKAASIAVNQRLVVRDWYAFTMSFKGVLLEGLEVIFIVISFADARASATHSAMLIASISALLAAVLAIGAGLIAHKPLTRVPENTMKYAVGIMLMSFGAFWSLEGLGVTWKRGELNILWIIFVLFALTQFLIVAAKRRKPARSGRFAMKRFSENQNSVIKFLYFWYDFIIGADWRMAAIMGESLSLGHMLGHPVGYLALGVAVALGYGTLRPL
jgi:uncharacterized membrane protein